MTNTRPLSTVGAEFSGTRVSRDQSSSPVAPSSASILPRPEATNIFPSAKAIPPPTPSLSVPSPSVKVRGSLIRSRKLVLPTRVDSRSIPSTLKSQISFPVASSMAVTLYRASNVYIMPPAMTGGATMRPFLPEPSPIFLVQARSNGPVAPVCWTACWTFPPACGQSVFT